MTELKTLKDLGNKNNWSKGEKLISEKEIKAEAIKWVKIFKYGTPSGHKFDIYDFASFFNLTEEDLK